MIAEQAELKLRMKAARALTTRDAVREFEQLLAGRGWVTRREIQRIRGDWSERFVRLLASASARVVSGPGTPGYCLADELEAEHLEHAASALIHQGRDMMRRGIRFRRLAALRRAQAALTITPA